MEGDRQSPLIALGAHYTTSRRGGNNTSISLITAIAAVSDPKDALIGVSHEIPSYPSADSEWAPSP
jgi:hypothetical protein